MNHAPFLTGLLLAPSQRPHLAREVGVGADRPPDLGAGQDLKPPAQPIRHDGERAAPKPQPGRADDCREEIELSLLHPAAAHPIREDITEPYSTMKTRTHVPGFRASPARPTLLRAGAAALALASGLQAQLILNGSFEDPAHSPTGLYGGVPTGWSGNSPFIFAGDIDGPGGWPAPQDGLQFIDIGYGETAPGVSRFTIFQSVTITTPGVYRLDWYHKTYAGLGNHRAAILDAGASPVAQGLFDSGGSGAWGQHSLTAFLAAGGYTVRFGSGPSSGLDTLLDNVTLTLVPEPGACAALAALGCLGWAMRRRDRA